MEGGDGKMEAGDGEMEGGARKEGNGMGKVQIKKRGVYQQRTTKIERKRKTRSSGSGKLEFEEIDCKKDYFAPGCANQQETGKWMRWNSVFVFSGRHWRCCIETDRKHGSFH